MKLFGYEIKKIVNDDVKIPSGHVHEWGKEKQWVRPDGSVFHASKCKTCGKVKD